MSVSARLKIPYLDESQASQELTYNDAVALIDALVGLSVPSKTTPATANPGGPGDGDTVLVGVGTGLFAGHNGEIAYYKQGWKFFTPVTGLMLFSEDDNLVYVFYSAAWHAV